MERMSRRGALRMIAGALVTAAVGVAQALSRDAGAATRGGPTQETYRGRRIVIDAGSARRPGLPLPADVVLIDGVPLHIMMNADATFTPTTNHYRTYPTLRAAAHAAVDDLGAASLLRRGHH